MGTIDPLNYTPPQPPAPKPPLDLDQWADQVVSSGKQFIDKHLSAPTPAPEIAQSQLAQQGATPPAPTPAAAETQRVVQVQASPEAGTFGNVLDSFTKVSNQVREFVNRDKTYRQAMRIDPSIVDSHPEIKAFYADYSTNLLSLQMEAQQVHFAMELASKVIEHGTSAAKTAMQTQV